MTGTLISNPVRLIAAAALALFACAQPAGAQFGGGYTPPPPPGYTPPPAASARNPACLRYESQLATLDRGQIGRASCRERV